MHYVSPALRLLWLPYAFTLYTIFHVFNALIEFTEIVILYVWLTKCKRSMYIQNLQEHISILQYE